MPSPSSTRGAYYAAACYLIWGAFPVYFRLLAPIPAFQILLHRMVWSLAFVALVLTVRREWGRIGGALRQKRLVGRFSASATVLAVNWFVYIWACNAGHVVDASLGYFINPLANVVLGAVLLDERLRPLQAAAVGLAAVGVAWLTWQGGHLPWIGLTLALSFSAYGLLRKTAPVGTLEGLALETLLLFPFALVALVWLTVQGQSVLPTLAAGKLSLLLSAGPVTAIPLLLFGAGARRISFSLLGLLQYICPTLQLLVGVLAFGEPFPPARAFGYALIWLALAAYSAESLWRQRRDARTPVALAAR